MGTEGERRESLVERKNQEAFVSVCEELDARLTKDVGTTFESAGREYEITSIEDCMVAFAQSMRDEAAKIHKEIVAKEDYYQEKAIAKLLELFKTYERMTVLYAELRSYYPTAAQNVESHIPSLAEAKAHAEKLWEEVQTKK